MTPETTYHLLRHLAANPRHSQRTLAQELNISLGKTNYCLRALLDRGYVKAINFKNSKNKRGYLYKLTPAGIKAKGRAARSFLAHKQAEYERLKIEIEELKREVAD